MLTTHIFRRPRRLRRLFRKTAPPRIIASFSFRYDAHLVPDLLENITPIVDGWVSFDDRTAMEPLSDEIQRKTVLLQAARELGAQWVLCIDPDERLEREAATRIRTMTKTVKPVIWGFHLREMYSAEAYRIDGDWGRKVRYRLFPVMEDQIFPEKRLHASWHPTNKEYRKRQSELNLYHLKMITRDRRVARRDLYQHVDPDRKYQAKGYGHLADDEGAVLERIAPGREYLPPHKDDGGLWMPQVAAFER